MWVGADYDLVFSNIIYSIFLIISGRVKCFFGDRQEIEQVVMNPLTHE